MKHNSEIGIFLKKIFTENWNEIFIIDSVTDKKLTYCDFFSKIIKFKEKLKDMKLTQKYFLCLIMDNSIDLAAIYFSSLLLGTKVIPIDPYKGNDEINEILDQLDNKKIISDKNITYNFLPSSKLIESEKNHQSTVVLDDLKVFDELNSDYIFLTTFTSGSTGKQKGVMHSFNNLFQSAISFQQKFNFDKNNIFLHNIPMTYMAGILNLLILPIISQSKIVVTNRTNISNITSFWSTPIKYSVNTFWLIPTVLELLLQLDRGAEGVNFTKKNKITICVGTSSLNVITKKNFEKKYHVELFESYGLSETLFVSTNFLNNNLQSSVGKMLPEVDIQILDDGEIAIKTPWMFKGYFNLSTEYCFSDKFFLSGDLGEINTQNFLFIVGRKKDIIIKGGINISPKKLEDFIINEEKFSECIIMGFKDKVLGEKITCFILKKDDIISLKKELNKKIITKLGKDYHIDEFIEINEIPKNINGKIDKPKIRELYFKNDFK